METHATKILLLAKLSFGLVIPSLFAAGVARVGWRKWFPAVFIGETIWTGTLVLLGFYASQAIRHIEKGLQLTILVVVFAGLAILLRFVSRVIQGRNGVGLSSVDEHIKH
jgi:membrane protein DedA with SNARE-associated domain